MGFEKAFGTFQKPYQSIPALSTTPQNIQKVSKPSRTFPEQRGRF